MYSMLDWVVQIGVDADVKVNRLSVVMRNVYIVVVVVVEMAFSDKRCCRI